MHKRKLQTPLTPAEERQKAVIYSAAGGFCSGYFFANLVTNAIDVLRHWDLEGTIPFAKIVSQSVYTIVSIPICVDSRFILSSPDLPNCNSVTDIVMTSVLFAMLTAAASGYTANEFLPKTD